MLQRLNAAPVQGVSLANVSLLRLDRGGGLAPGNKSFKLQPYFSEASQLGIRRLVSFGGAWSNHLHALAALGHERGVETVGIVRSGADEGDTAMLVDARAWGMELVRVSRTEYRQRHNPDYQRALRERFAPCLLIPEGGAAVAGMEGCREIGRLIARLAPQARRIVVPVGTGTTLAGLACSVGDGVGLYGISALKGASDLEQRIEALLRDAASDSVVDWSIRHDFHCGGFARTNGGLREFMQAFEAVQGIELEPVYTAKMLYAIQQLLARGEWQPDTPVLAIHTGGLQGRRGYPWLGSVSSP
ncbi:MAG: pyridoxal-phosphate dependent enzyme [Halioglobus sp.]|nr:pyridoxal-phosphate dependent enzyme [Halioglobus sp.]